MATYDFDREIDRRGTHSIKYDAIGEVFGREGLIPLWVADMDFATPDFVIEALKRRLEHPILGYTTAYDGYWKSIEGWLWRRHSWQVKREWLRYIPGIVKGIGMVLACFTKPGDKVIIQPPVYHPFRLVPEHNGREVVCNPLRALPDGGYEMDFEQLEQIIDEHCKVLILSNPHNPAGIVWDKVTLQRLADIALKYRLLVVSDEIHCDMPLYGNVHTPFATVSEAAARCSITFGAPTKTFNVAGVVSSYVVVPADDLREQFFGYLSANELDMPTIFAMVATEAAFNEGEAWRRALVNYIEANVDFVADYLVNNLPAVKMFKPQASYLIWLDFSGLGLSHKALVDMIINGAHLAMNDGEMFGTQGTQHMRMNVGLPRRRLAQALEQLREAINGCIK